MVAIEDFHATSYPPTSVGPREATRAWRRIGVALALSIPTGIPVLFLAYFSGVYGGGQDRWQLPYAAGVGFLYAVLVFAYTFPATRRYWGDGNGAVMSALTGIVGCFGVFLGSLGTLIVWFLLWAAFFADHPPS